MWQGDISEKDTLFSALREEEKIEQTGKKGTLCFHTHRQTDTYHISWNISIF